MWNVEAARQMMQWTECRRRGKGLSGGQMSQERGPRSQARGGQSQHPGLHEGVSAGLGHRQKGGPRGYKEALCCRNDGPTKKERAPVLGGSEGGQKGRQEGGPRGGHEGPVAGTRVSVGRPTRSSSASILRAVREAGRRARWRARGPCRRHEGLSWEANES